MPIYEYICKDCGHHFDAIRSFKDADSLIHCKQCDSDQTRRMISLFFAQSDSRSMAGGSQNSCSGCSGGSCSGCRH